MSELSSQVRTALNAAIAAIGGSPREGQIEMAEAVANALTNRHHLMVQAGTGTGKSLAYLVPALVHGRKVLVATATLALQRQLVERDLPAVVPALEKVLGRTISYGIYKGVGNYLCLQKMNSDGGDPDGKRPYWPGHRPGPCLQYGTADAAPHRVDTAGAAVHRQYH